MIHDTLTRILVIYLLLALFLLMMTWNGNNELGNTC